MDATELFENSSRAADCHHYEVSELAKSKGWTEGKGALPRFAWIEYGKTFGEFDDEGLSNAGTAIYVGDEKLLIGNINEAGGVCMCCPGVNRSDIVSHYWPDVRVSEIPGLVE